MSHAIFAATSMSYIVAIVLFVATRQIEQLEKLPRHHE